MTLHNYPWLQSAYHTISEPLMHGRAHHALLVNYVKNSGENMLINHYVMRLLCKTPVNQQPCQQCHSCQLFSAQNHPDFYVVEPEQNKLSIGVDQIRAITQKVYERSQQGGAKVLWIKTAGKMTEPAANALLKTLEEPPESTYFILSDQHNSHLLPTIHSRCAYYFIELPNTEDSINWLKQSNQLSHHYNDNELATALLLNENAPFAALMLLDAEKWQIRQEFCHTIHQQFTQHNVWALRDCFIKSENYLENMHWFCTLLSDAIKALQKTGRFIINRDQVPLVRLLATYGVDKIIKIYELWLNARMQLMTVTGLNQELMISHLLAQTEVILAFV